MPSTSKAVDLLGSADGWTAPRLPDRWSGSPDHRDLQDAHERTGDLADVPDP